ncbi:peroxisome biogenesis factor 1 isoform X1 [Corythoichthys intestinalis]|uniref:peroxisome biogenesis factor 1 isoform X1 n=1 Tax=Corythoichthys intestinalis TaxID=161448 RepID=UPI0025A4D8B3|nr:peroxisome biogenesis factor 1 isoform X1 [Corythoichthys intestinalis]
MFSGIQPVTVVFNNAKNCFLHVPAKLISHLSLSENQALELSWSHDGPPVFLSWTLSRSSSNFDNHHVEMCRHLAEKLGLLEGEEGFLRACPQVSSVRQVFVEPLSADDWEILELHSGALEEHLLDQIRVVFPDAVLPVWVDSHTVLYIQIASLLPSVPYGRLEPFSELMVTPKKHTRHPEVPHHSHWDTPSTPRPPLQTSPPLNQQWGGITDLKSLFRYLTKGSSDPVREVPFVPEVPALLPDALYRVCGASPPSLTTASHVAPGVLHIFPCSYTSDLDVAGGQPELTYGLLSKVPSPKERAKVEKKKNAPADGVEEVKDQELKQEATVVRLVCHDIDELRYTEGTIHCGTCWIPPVLAARLNILPHSTVRIKPVTSTVKVASSIQLWPQKPLFQTEAEEDEDIQTAFLSWLHTQTHRPLACLTPRVGSVLLHATDDKLEFTVTVLKPESEPESEPPDQLFLLSPSVLQKKHIQVVREPVSAPPVEIDPPKQDLPSLSSLGGVDELSSRSFEFISYSLLASPLSRELLGVIGRGLKGGALLITGAQGSGKSALSRALCRKAADDVDAHVEVVECKMLQGKRAETIRRTLQEVFTEAEWRQPSVVLLDDLDDVARAPTSPEHEEGPEELLHLHVAQSLMDIVDEMVERDALICLIVTSEDERSLHSTLTQVQGRHFFQGFTHINPPEQAQRSDILCRAIETRCGSCQSNSVNLDLSTVVRETEGYLPQDLLLLLERALHANAARQLQNNNPGSCLLQQDFNEALRDFTPPSRWGADLHTPSGEGLKSVGGLAEVRQQLMDTILLPAKYPVLFSKLPIRHRSGVLLYGAPGTGKTLLARAVAKDSGMNFISIKGPELLSKYIGASEKAVRDVFQRAQAAKPCVVFFDEFDSLAPRRGHDSTGVTDRVVNQLLTQLDGAEGLEGVYVLAATNRPDLIDPALLRPGRLDKSLYCPPPGKEDRLAILKILSTGISLAPDVDLENLAEATHGFTGADLKALLYNAQLETLNSSLDGSMLQETTCDMSLSSMIFPNNSSGSDDLVDDGEGDEGSCPESAELQRLDEHRQQQEHPGDAWRIYFGSSFESESAECVSVQDAEVPTPESSLPLPPLAMPSLKSGFQPLSHEQQQRLQQEVACIKLNHRRANGERVRARSKADLPGILLRRCHVLAALDATRPSLGKDDWSRYQMLYEAFSGGRTTTQTFQPGQRVTLA